MAEFAANNTELEIISHSLFFANYGYKSLYRFKLYIAFIEAILLAQIIAKEFANIIKDYLVYLKEKMAIAQAKYKDNMNRS